MVYAPGVALGGPPQKKKKKKKKKKNGLGENRWDGELEIFLEAAARG
jgi:hypothetical protein